MVLSWSFFPYAFEKRNHDGSIQCIVHLNAITSISPSSFFYLRRIFTLFSLPLSPLQAVWDSSCVCGAAGPDPYLLQRERWKDPQLLQHCNPLPTVCQQCQTGGYWPQSDVNLYPFVLLGWVSDTQLTQNVKTLIMLLFSLLQRINVSMRRVERSVSSCRGCSKDPPCMS